MRRLFERGQTLVGAVKLRPSAEQAALLVVGTIALFGLAGYLIDPASLSYGVAAADVGPVLIAGLSLIAVAVALVAAPRPVRAAAVAALLVVSLVSSAAIAGTSLAHRAETEGIRAAVETLLRDPDLPKDAQFYVVAQVYPANTRLTIQPQVGEAFDTPQWPVPTRFVMVDLAPAQMLGHPILYAQVTADGRQVLGRADREWFATIGDIPYWSADDAMEVNGRLVALLEPPAVSWIDTEGWSRWVSAFVRELTRGSVAAADGKKKAVVIDGGDKWIEIPPSRPLEGSLGLAFAGDRRAELMRKFNQIDVRRSINDQANQLSRELEGRGFEVTRLSGFGVDPNPAPTPDRIRQSIQDAARDAAGGGELFVHFIAHGSKEGLALHDKECDAGGSAGCFRQTPFRYAELGQILEGLDPALKKTVAINACHSGAAAELLSKIKGLDLHTATTADGKTPAGVNPANPSWTQTLIDKLRAEVGDDAVAAALKKVAEAHKAQGAGIVEAIEELIALLPVAPPAVEVAGPSADPTATPRPATPRPTLRTVATFTISGIVVDSITGQPVTNAQVTAFRVSGSFASQATAVSGAGGAFSFQLPAGSYRLRLASVFGEFPGQDWSGTLTVERARAVVVQVQRPST